ncbi:glycosyltransferase [Candidatus Uhrbacteria bacterium]|nr:glycosyltransferase [Candidatus Uhrbacteria bacterium]
MRILLVGGGTLGSVTPLLAVAEELQRQKTVSDTVSEKVSDTVFWGTRMGPERVLVEAMGIPFRSIPAGKLRRYWDARNLFDLFVVKWAFWVALVRLIRWRSSVVVGAGSFVQVPVLWAAWVLRIPIVIHQQDVRPGLANRLVAPFARAITATFPETARMFRGRPVTVVGNPVRRAVLAAR